MNRRYESLSTLFSGLLFSVFIPSFLMSMSQGIILLMIPLYALDLGANAGITALIFSLRGLGNIVFDIPAGSIASRLGDKTTMLIGTGVMATCGLATSFADTPLELGVAAFLFGGAMASWLIGRLTHIAESVDASHRGKTIATMAGLQRFGNLLGPVLAGIIATRFGFQTVFLMVFVISFSALCMVMIFISNQRTADDEESHPSILHSLPAVVRTHLHVFATAGIAMLMLTVLRASRHLLIPLWGEHLGLDAQQIGFIVGAAAAVDMCMFPIAGYVMDYHGRKPVAVYCLAFLTLGMVTMPLTSGAITLGLAAMLAGLGNGLGSGINMTLGTDLSPDENRGEFLGVWRLIGDTGSLGGPLLLGGVIEALSLGAAFGAVGLAGILGILIVTTLVRETREPVAR
jgi:MFS family permease